MAKKRDQLDKIINDSIQSIPFHNTTSEDKVVKDRSFSGGSANREDKARQKAETDQIKAHTSTEHTNNKMREGLCNFSMLVTICSLSIWGQYCSFMLSLKYIMLKRFQISS